MPTSMTATSTPAARTTGTRPQVRISNSVEWPVALVEPLGRVKDLVEQAHEVGHGDWRAVDEDSFPIRDEVWLGRLAHPIAGLAQRRSDQRLGAALAVGATDQNSSEMAVRVAQCAEECSGPSEAQAHAKAAARL